MKNAIRNTAATLSLALLAVPIGATAEKDEAKEAKEHDELSRAMSDAKYEIENGKLQLSVYTMKGDKFSEVIVDHGTGKVAKAEAITSGEDLAAAQEQKQAIAKAKRSLAAATTDATKKNPGYRAVSAIPRIDEGHPVAAVTLLKGDDWKTVSERLDSAQ